MPANKFINFTQLPEKEAKEKLISFKDLVERGETDRRERLDRDEENNKFWLGEIWTDKQLNEFFNKLDLTPYEIAVQRPLVNNLISRQRNRGITFQFVPKDIHSYKRFRQGREEFINEEMNVPTSPFQSPEEAGRYYDHYADDQYAEAVTAYMQNVRDESKAKYTESSTFQQGLISGLDFFKAIFSRKYNRNGGIEIARRPQRAVFYDESSVEYDLSDIEFIGEVHRLYKDNLITQYPGHKEEIEDYFSYYTNKDRKAITRHEQDWKYFYDFSSRQPDESRVKVAELWYLDHEERYIVFDNEENDSRVVQYGKEEQEIMDSLMSMTLIELEAESNTDEEALQLITSDNAKEEIRNLVEERFEIQTTIEPIWYKAVFTYNALLEYKRAPLPHGSHPYFPFFAQFSEGNFTSLMDDIKDIVIAINKALAFRELIIAHGAKGLVVVDEDVLMRSGYDIDDIASVWTSIGSVVALKLKRGEQISEVFQNITTVGEGLEAINYVLQDLDSKLYRVSGVNLEQLGMVQRQTTASGYRQQVAEGEVNNGLIFDNFIRSMETFYNDKVIPLVVWMLKNRREKVLRKLGDQHHPWIEVDLGEDFDLFEEAVRNKQYSTALKPITDNAQLQEERSSRYMEMALAGMLDPEIAIEFGTDPDRHKILKRMKEKELERIRRQSYNMFSYEEFMQVAAETGLPFSSVEEVVEEMKKRRALEQQEGGDPMSPQPTGEQVQRQQGGQGRTAAPNIRETGSESERLQQIDRTEQS